MGVTRLLWIIAMTLLIVTAGMFVVSFYMYPIYGYPERALDTLREFLGMPISDLCVMFHFEDFSGEESGTIIKDSSNHGNDGILMDADHNNYDLDSPPIFGMERKAIIDDGALVFDGVDDYVDISESPAYPGWLNPGKAITIDLWIKLLSDPDCDNNPATNNWRYILSKGSDANMGKDGVYQLILEDDSTITAKFMIEGVERKIHSETYLDIGAKSHVAVTYENLTGKAQIFINGFLDARKTIVSGNISTNQENLRIGGWNFVDSDKDCPVGGAGVPHAVIDEVRIYNRALSSREIMFHWQAVYKYAPL